MNIEKSIAIALGLESQSSTDIGQPVSQITGEVITETVEESALELQEVADELDELQSKVESLAESEASLESYISFMEQQLLIGGMNKHTARGVNIGLESIASRYGIPSAMISASLEDVVEDQEGETKKTAGRAKELLGKIKSGASKLLLRVLTFSIKLIMSIEKLHTKVIAEAKELKNNIAPDNAGGADLGNFAFSKYLFSSDGDMDPAKYVKELADNNKILRDITNIWDPGKLEMFIAEVNKTVKDFNAKPDFTKVKDVIKGVQKHTSHVKANDEFTDEYHSAPMLGGVFINLRAPNKDQISYITKQSSTLVARDGVYTKGHRFSWKREALLTVVAAITKVKIQMVDTVVSEPGLVQKIYDLMLFTDMELDKNKLKTGSIKSLSSSEIAKVCDEIIATEFLSGKYKSFMKSKKAMLNTLETDYKYYVGDDNEQEVASAAAASQLADWFLRVTNSFENDFIKHTVYMAQGALNYAKKSNAS